MRDAPRLTASEAASLVRPHLAGDVGDTLEAVGEGDFCFAYRTGAHIVRVAKHAEAAAGIRREACVLGRIADRVPLDVPRPTFHEPAGAPPFSIHREVVGAVLTREAWEDLPIDRRALMAARLAAFLVKLHALAGEGVRCEVPRLDERVLATRLRSEVEVELAGHLSPAALRRLDAVLATRAEDAAPRPVALLHCDLAPGHVLYDAASGEPTGVIDFGDLAVGPPARDFIFLYEDFGLRLCEDVVAAYAGGDAAALMDDVRTWYLLEAVSWTLGRLRGGRSADVAHGLGEIRRVLGC